MSQPTPPLHAEVRAAVDGLLDKLIDHYVSEHPDPDMTEDCKYAEDVRNEIFQAVADALLARLPEKDNRTPISDASMSYQNGYNDALDAVTRVIGKLRGENHA